MHFRQVQATALDQVKEASRRAHHHLHSAAKLVQLLAVGRATINGQHAHAHELTKRLDHLGHLQSQFAGGGNHQGLRQILLRVDAVEDR